jgi:RimJ/RimL family protein N-acetyltransferase
MSETKESLPIPSLQPPLKFPVENHITNEICQIASVDQSYKESKTDIDQFTEMLNEPIIYNLFYAHKIPNHAPVTANSAQSLIKDDIKGWTEKTSYGFFIRNNEEKIIGHISLEAKDVNSAAIHYMFSENFRGVATNTVLEICELAKEAGFQKLIADTIETNEKSQGVLTRAGFTPDGGFSKLKTNVNGEKKVTVFNLYSKNL